MSSEKWKIRLYKSFILILSLLIIIPVSLYPIWNRIIKIIYFENGFNYISYILLSLFLLILLFILINWREKSKFFNSLYSFTVIVTNLTLVYYVIILRLYSLLSTKLFIPSPYIFKPYQVLTMIILILVTILSLIFSNKDNDWGTVSHVALFTSEEECLDIDLDISDSKYERRTV